MFPQSVLRDVDSIPLGVDFRAYLDEQVAKCDVFLAVIGRDWMKAKGRKGKSRLDDPGDFVRIEIESALTRQIPVIPVLVRGAKIPEAERLPPSMQSLSYRNGIVVRPDPDFHKDMDRLIVHLKQLVPRLSESQAEPTTQSKPVLTEQPFLPPATPVDMVKIPKGLFLYGDKKTHETIDHDYWIDKYPVTNEKYRAFIEAGGYENQRYWSSDGWQWKTKKNVTSPKYWNDSTGNKVDHPVVGVSYYEAEAFAKWSGKRLPTEQEWEKAARGENGHQYPWGEEFDKTRCNSADSDIEHTTPVTQYPDGISLYGCFDVAGNVWEWCASWFDGSGDQRVIRGGSWCDGPGYMRTSCRGRGFHFNRKGFLGFRLVKDIP